VFFRVFEYSIFSNPMTPEIQVADQSALELTRFSLPQCCDLHPEKGMRKQRFENEKARYDVQKQKSRERK